MPCCVDTIVKINQVHITDKKETNLTVVWAIGTYPVEVEDRDMEMVLFVLFDKFERDFNTQSIFRKDEYYSVDGKITPGSYNDNLKLKMIVATSTHLAIKKEPGLNRCPLKISLVGTIQDTAKEINTENAMIKMEVIQKDLYIYAIETSYVDISTDKKEVYSSSQSASESPKSVRSTLLIAHQGINDSSSKISTVDDHNNNKEMEQSVVNSLPLDFHSPKHVKLENETHEHVDSDIVENSYMFEYNKEYVDEDDELEENAINQNEKNKHNSEKIESIIHEGEHMIEYNKKYTDKDNDLGENIISQNKNNKHNREKMKNKIHEDIDSYIVEDVEQNKEYMGESSEPGKNIINQNEKKYNRKKVYNTRKQTEIFKNINNKNDDELEENAINQNEKNKHNSEKIESIIHEGEHMIEYNKKYTDKDNDLGENIISQNKNNKHNREKMKNKIHEDIDSYIVEDVEQNKEYMGESSEPGKNIINQNEKKYNRKKVYNTRKQTEIFKNINNKNGEK
ncbi:hypothetical protein Glove_33g174 [Diversispora epigaea]|uniref:Uncharacterized protein n=1 Tax=Diversispora epigaea TaxID=1348612 RepID=A0A397JJA4_9GLOM|nr:hypothetical protein Glove_33g174 [Diversispora epigaea]